MAKKNIIVATEKDTVVEEFLTASTYESYSDLSPESQIIEDFACSAKPKRIPYEKPTDEERENYMQKVFARTVRKVSEARYSFDLAITTVCYEAVKHAYQKRAPWIVDSVLSELRTVGKLSAYEQKKVVAYFRASGLDITTGVATCKAIRDISKQKHVLAKMKGVYVLSFSIKRPESEGSRTLADGDIAKRTREALNKAHASAKENAAAAEKAGNVEAANFFNKEKALNTATKDILMLLKDCEDPIKVVEEFKAWFNNAHSKELTAK